MIHHSAAVHMPMALAVLFPLGYVLVLISIHRRWLPKNIWFALIGLSSIQVVTLMISFWTGLRDRSLSSASVELLNHHEGLALIYCGLWIALTLTLPFAFLTRGRWSVALHCLALLINIIQLALAVGLGHLGGQILFGG